MANEFVITILDMPEIMEIVEDALAAVPDWERAQLTARLEAVIARALAARARPRTIDPQ